MPTEDEELQSFGHWASGFPCPRGQAFVVPPRSAWPTPLRPFKARVLRMPKLSTQELVPNQLFWPQQKPKKARSRTASPSRSERPSASTSKRRSASGREVNSFIEIYHKRLQYGGFIAVSQQRPSDELKLLDRLWAFALEHGVTFDLLVIGASAEVAAIFRETRSAQKDVRVVLQTDDNGHINGLAALWITHDALRPHETPAMTTAEWILSGMSSCLAGYMDTTSLFNAGSEELNYNLPSGTYTVQPDFTLTHERAQGNRRPGVGGEVAFRNSAERKLYSLLMESHDPILGINTALHRRSGVPQEAKLKAAVGLKVDTEEVDGHWLPPLLSLHIMLLHPAGMVFIPAISFGQGSACTGPGMAGFQVKLKARVLLDSTPDHAHGNRVANLDLFRLQQLIYRRLAVQGVQERRHRQGQPRLPTESRACSGGQRFVFSAAEILSGLGRVSMMPSKAQGEVCFVS